MANPKPPPLTEIEKMPALHVLRTEWKEQRRIAETESEAAREHRQVAREHQQQADAAAVRAVDLARVITALGGTVEGPTKWPPSGYLEEAADRRAAEIVDRTIGEAKPEVSPVTECDQCCMTVGHQEWCPQRFDVVAAQPVADDLPIVRHPVDASPGEAERLVPRHPAPEALKNVPHDAVDRFGVPWRILHLGPYTRETAIEAMQAMSKPSQFHVHRFHWMVPHPEHGYLRPMGECAFVRARWPSADAWENAGRPNT